MSGIRMTGLASVVSELKSVGEKVGTNARKTMGRKAEKIVEQAKKNAPADEHNLEESIKMERSYDGVHGRLSITIVAGGVVNGRNVDEYALIMHEGSYNLGPGSIAKQTSTGARVGPKYLERAVKEHRDALRKAVIEAVTKEVRK